MTLNNCFYVAVLFGFVHNEIPSIAKVRDGANIFSNILDYHTNKITQYKALNEDFKSISSNLVFKKKDGHKMNENFNKGIADIFVEKERTVQSLRNAVIQLKEESIYDDELEVFPYPNVRDVANDISQKNASLLEDVFVFPTDVLINMTRSFVHIPTNIYGYSVDILNKVRWTEQLDPVFIKNQQSDGSLIMESYCDSSGFLRMYPGNLNGYISDQPDLYDCRRRVWYQISSTSQKDVVIVIDTSGSMAGTTMVIGAITAKALIDTLEENDYFNVITVGKTSSYLKPCIPFLIQATKFNKERMKMEINKIPDPKDVLDLSKGITAAFQTLYSEVNYNRTYTAGCNKLIMVISDGIEGDYTSAAKDVFDKLNARKKVRVFSYLVGRKKNPDDRALKEMSCNNRGYFYKVETLNNVWDTVLEYLEVLSRPIARRNDEVKSKITPLYLDSAGAGMILTVSLGVFSSGNYSGVVGVDMLIRALKQEVPVSSLGYFSHTVVVNNNGFIILHPKLKNQTGYLTPPTNIYFEDLEYSVNKNDSKILKQHMLSSENGTMYFPTYWLYDDNRKIAENNMTYYFNPVNNTLLFSSLALSDADITYFEVDRNISNSLYQNGLNALYVSPPENSTNTSASPITTYVDIPAWLFCNITSNDTKSTTDVKVYPTASEIYKFLSDFNSIENILDVCDETMVSSLLVTAGLAFPRINESWAGFLAEKQYEDPDFLSLYVGTSGGYTRLFSTNATIVTRDSLRTAIFEQAIAMPFFNIIVSTPNRSIYDDEVVFLQVKASSWIEHDGERVLVAVTGTEMNSGLIKEMFDNMTLSIALDCKDNNSIVCAIVDQNGYIVVSNQGERTIGHFLGEIQGKLMEHFSSPDISIFRKIVLEDNQGVCLEPKEYDSNSNYLLTPFKLALKITTWILSSTGWLIYRMLILTISLFRIPFAFSQNSDNYIEISCTKIMSFFLFQNQKWEELLVREEQAKKSKRSQVTLRNVDCGASRSQSYVLAPVPNTNLIFIVADQPDSFSCRKNPIYLLKNKNQDDDFCTQEELFRVMPGKCYNETHDEEELSEFCGSASNLDSSVTIVLNSLLLILLFNIRIYFF